VGPGATAWGRAWRRRRGAAVAVAMRGDDGRLCKQTLSSARDLTVGKKI
jgi:hypothetical protein